MLNVRSFHERPQLWKSPVGILSHYQLTMLHKILKMCYLGRGTLTVHIIQNTTLKAKHYIYVQQSSWEAQYHQDNIGAITNVSFT